MELSEYQELAMRTAKNFDTKHMNLIHAALGIGSETGEFSETISQAWMKLPFLVENICEELGDVSWYVALLSYHMGWKFEDLFLEAKEAADMSEELATAVVGRNPVALTLVLNSFAGEVLSMVKAHVVYGKELDTTKLNRKLSLLIVTVSLISDIHDIHYETVCLPFNIDKLQKRYPEKYTDHAALVRADKPSKIILNS